ncbi:MAG: HlyD family efflux transporter periplasmic adaptor subunit [Bacteroidales bacterium]|nr:HlyD family efflux transporter periplasmic adaptor subunit [Bacteroidales bacterium]
MKNRKLILIIWSAFAGLISCTEGDRTSDAYGNFEATEITISAQATGEILEFAMDEGDFLKAGQIIGWIDTTDLSLKKAQIFAQKEAIISKISNLDAQIAVYEQQKVNIQRDRERIGKMYQDGAATQKQVDDISGQIDVIEKQIKSVKSQQSSISSEAGAIQKQIAQVEESISKSIITNPMDGVVLTKYVNAHEMAVVGKPLYKLADLREMTLKVYASGSQIPQVKIGQQVKVLVDVDKENTKILSGTVSWVSESAEFTPKIIQTRDERVNMVYAVKVLVKNDGTLKIGMPGEINF